MARLRPKLINKQIKKKTDKKCYFCPCSDYGLLDVHRIQPGSEGGKYTGFNSITVCANCHRKIHENKIVILGRHFSTAGYVLHFIEDGVEKWK